MAYCYIEDIDASLVLVHMIQTCSKYFPTPTVIDGEDLQYKLRTLNKLYTMWVEEQLNDSSYQSEIYKRICEMFFENVFRHLPLYSYTPDGEINIEMMWELKQLYPVYKVFMAFLNLKGFDEEKLMPYVGETFINALIQRVVNSCMETERDCVKQILFLLFEKTLYLKKYILQCIINSLLDNGPINMGIKELLELFKTLMGHRLVKSKIIAKVLSPLIKRNDLCHYSRQLHECFKIAAHELDTDLGAWFVDNVIDYWSASAADVRTLCQTLAELYFQACGPKQKRQTRQRVIRHVVDFLRTAAAVAVDGTTVATFLAYAEFCNRLIDDAAANDWKKYDSREAMECVAEGLIAVYRDHSNYECINYASRLLRRLVNDERCLVSDAYRLAILQVLIENRPQMMIENLVDNTF